MKVASRIQRWKMRTLISGKIFCILVYPLYWSLLTVFQAKSKQNTHVYVNGSLCLHCTDTENIHTSCDLAQIFVDYTFSPANYRVRRVCLILARARIMLRDSRKYRTDFPMSLFSFSDTKQRCHQTVHT